MAATCTFSLPWSLELKWRAGWIKSADLKSIYNTCKVRACLFRFHWYVSLSDSMILIFRYVFHKSDFQTLRMFSSYQQMELMMRSYLKYKLPDILPNEILWQSGFIFI